MCEHQPRCPGAKSPQRDAARILVPHPEQGWYLLCNKVVRFEDGGELLPDGTALPSYVRAGHGTPANAQREKAS
ncbi:DUF5999 family protein [Streptomyces sp. NPDC091376]|uniref:DUF5999 family protein n=1 Tax=Streptomyces sp. NPDC091376 TaxID=3365994 RepID=UPI00381FC09F